MRGVTWLAKNYNTSTRVAEERSKELTVGFPKAKESTISAAIPRHQENQLAMASIGEEERRPRKHLSSIANSLLLRCAQELSTTAEDLVKEFEAGLKPSVDNYSRRLVEFCSLRALEPLSHNLGEKISDGMFSRFTFDMMLAWEKASDHDDARNSECIAKEKEDDALLKEPLIAMKEDGYNDADDVPLFYSDMMPLLVNGEPSVGEDSYAWFGSLFPLASDIVNARFTFETLTTTTANRLHYPAYDRFLKEMDKCIASLQQQSTPTGIKLADDEFVLHVEGNPNAQKVVRHIGSSSSPGRMTLTNKALYFEASGYISYEPALKIDLSKPDVDHQVKTASTGPWGAPLFDKAISYQTPQLSEPLILEFPEMTGSTRRDLCLALIKEVILLHRFISTYNLDSPLHAWEIHSRTILGVLRLHGAREMLKMSPPPPNGFLIFALYEDVPKGDYVLEEMANSLKQTSKITPFGATDVLRRLDLVSHPSESVSMQKIETLDQEEHRNKADSLDTTIGEVREEAKEASIAKAGVQEVKEEGISDSLLILSGLLRPLNIIWVWIQKIVSWERPMLTSFALAITLIIIYIEGVGYALAALMASMIGEILWARRRRLSEIPEVVIDASSDKTTMENVVEAQHTLKSLQEIVKKANIIILKLWSLATSRSQKHTDRVMWVMTGVAIVCVVVPFKYILMGVIMSWFMGNTSIAKSMSDPQGGRRMREWWDSIPVVSVRTVA
ncbi:hypothetical protein LUZ60_005558 [Juncus effusus]|nr:hypothetical protein LUZ60_005558 [Juncus effusus]